MPHTQDAKDQRGYTPCSHVPTALWSN